MTSAEAALQVNCGTCWSRPGQPCVSDGEPLAWPHHQRLTRAQRKLAAGRAELLAELTHLRHFEVLALTLRRSGFARGHGQLEAMYGSMSWDQLAGRLLP